jgi:hypothetical protein
MICEQCGEEYKAAFFENCPVCHSPNKREKCPDKCMDTIDQLLAEATPLPWTAELNHYTMSEGNVVAVFGGRELGSGSFNTRVATMHPWPHVHRGKVNAKLIAHVVNVFPDVLQLLRKLEEETSNYPKGSSHDRHHELITPVLAKIQNVCEPTSSTENG